MAPVISDSAGRLLIAKFCKGALESIISRGLERTHFRKRKIGSQDLILSGLMEAGMGEIHFGLSREHFEPQQKMFFSASAACGTCKRQKKRCDRKLPSCSRCIFVRSECKYGDGQSLALIQNTEKGYKDTLTSSNLFFHCPDINHHIVQDTFFNNGISDVHASVLNYAYRLLSSNGDGIEKMLAEYFSTIGSWLPAISRKKVYQNLSQILSAPRADFVLLLLSIHLVLEPPFRSCDGSASRSPVYHKTKQLSALLQSADFLSIEVVQAALLVTLYEYGHGYLDSAFLSVGLCARMADALRWHKRKGFCDESVLEEERRVWWAIRVFERLLDLEPDFPPTANSPSTNIELPTENEDWDLPPNSTGQASPYPQTAYLQAKAVQMMGRAISLSSNPPRDIGDRRQDKDNLKTSLVQFALAVTECSRHVWGANCGALGLTYSAIYHLCLSPSPSLSSPSPSSCPTPAPGPHACSLLELQRTTHIVVDIARTFCFCLLSARKAHLGLCSPLTLHALHHAALTHIALAWDEDEDEGDCGGDDGYGKLGSDEWESGLRDLRAMLGFVSERWGLAAKLLTGVQQAYDRRMCAREAAHEGAQA